MSDSFYVYMHKNKINNKVYIGITSKTNPEYRWGKDGKNYYNQVFGVAIKKYGWENFEHIILHSGLTFEEAKDKEICLIREYREKLGVTGVYNTTLGGDYHMFSGLIICIETGEIYENSKDVIDKLDCILNGKYSENDITLCCRCLKKYVRKYRKKKDYKLHFQYYTSNYETDIKKIEEKCDSNINKITNKNDGIMKKRIEERMEFKKFNEELVSGNNNYLICECCGKIMLRRGNNQKYCGFCKTKKDREKSIYKKVPNNYKDRKLKNT